MTHQFRESHPRFAGFSAYYEREIAPWLAEHEAERRRLVRQTVRRCVLIAVIAVPVALLVWLAISNTDARMWGLIVTGFLAFGAGAIAALPLMRFKARLKGFLAGKVCGFLGFTFSPSLVSHEMAWFRELSLVPSYDRQSLEDRIEGDDNGVRFDLFEAHLEDRRTRTDSKGRTRTYYVTVFRGMLGKFTFPKRFAGRTIVSRDRGLIGNWFGKFGRGGERVELEDPRFEKAFEVYSTDQVEARYLLTPTFMERLVALADLMGGKLQLAFDQDHMLLSINGTGDRFEGGSIFKPLTDTKRTQALIDELAIIFDIIETLQLSLKTRV